MSTSQETTQQTYQAVLEALQHLVEVVAKLRSPDGGCPWDLAQTPKTLIPYVIEEAYEVVEAIGSENQDAIAEELGDLLLQVVLLESMEGLFLSRVLVLQPPHLSFRTVRATFTAYGS